MSCNNCTSGSSCSSGSCSFENNNASGTCTSSTPHCGKCCGGSCSSVREIVLSPLELSLLQLFSVYPFLPAARDKDGMPVYFPDASSDMSATSADDISACLYALEAKQIISVDEDIPIAGYDYSIYHDLPLHGSMALTAFGQDILDSLIYQNSAPGLSVL